MPATLKAFLLSTALLSTPALAGEGQPPMSPLLAGAADHAGKAAGEAAGANPARAANGAESGDIRADLKANDEALLKSLGKMKEQNSLLASALAETELSRLDVATYRLVLPSPVTSTDPDEARALWGKVRDDVRATLSGASQADARARLARLGDVSTALPLVGLNPSDEERDTLVLSSETHAYVKTVQGVPGRGEAGSFATLRTGDRIRVHGTGGTDGYHVAYEAESRHLVHMDRYSVQGVSVDLPNVSQAESTGDLDLKAMAKAADAGASGPRPVGLVDDPGTAKGVSAVSVRDTADREGRTVEVYVFSVAR